MMVLHRTDNRVPTNFRAASHVDVVNALRLKKDAGTTRAIATSHLIGDWEWLG